MSLSAPIVVIADQPTPELLEALASAGGFPIVESSWAKAPEAFVAIKPSAIVLAEPGQASQPAKLKTLNLQLQTAKGPLVPVIARVNAGEDPPIPSAIRIDASAPVARLVARLSAALRVRTLHAATLRRMATFEAQSGRVIKLPAGDPVDDATVLLTGRGRTYPGLSVALGERFGLLGALSVETAGRHLNARTVDGIVIGEGFAPRMVEAFLTVLAEDARFRDLPIVVAGRVPPGDVFDALPNLDHIGGDPSRVVEHLLPMVRLHALQEQLNRVLASLDADGLLDAETSLLIPEAFRRDLDRAVDEAKERSGALSIGRFCFDLVLARRASLDVARLVSRLMRKVDFACREADGSILAVFTETDLRGAHVIARRIASVLKHTMLAPNGDRRLTPSITLATLKPGDTPGTLVARVAGGAVAAMAARA